MPRRSMVLSLLLAASCAGDGGTGVRDAVPPDAVAADGGADAPELDLGGDRAAGGDGAADDAEPDVTGPVPFERAAILTAQGGAGSISVIDIDTLAATPDLQPAPGNATARYTGGHLFLLDRGGDAVTIRNVDADLTLQKTFSIGGGSSLPQDICCTAPGRCYVPRIQDPGLLIIDPRASPEAQGEIDLSSLDGDANPNAYTCQRHLGQLFVGLRRLSDPGQMPQQPGRIAVIDLGTQTLADDFDTATLGPITRFQTAGSGRTAWIGEAGLTGVADGTLNDVDLSTPSATESLVNETGLGANLYRFAVCDSGEAWVIAIGLMPPGPATASLRKVDLTTGMVDPPLYSTTGPDLTWIAADTMNRIWVADRSPSPDTGIRLWNCDGSALSPDPNPIAVGIYPPNAEGTITFIP